MTRIIVAGWFVLFASLQLSAGTGFHGVAGGAKKYTLNDKVGANNLQFISEAPLENITGTANGISGDFTLDPANLEATKGLITVQVKSMKTAITKRDGHMYSNVWLDAEKYPTISYNVTGLQNISVSSEGGKHIARATAIGMFTCHGVTKPLTATIELQFLPESDETKKRATGNLVMITASFNVKLADFDIKGKEGLVGSSVGEIIKISAKLFAHS